MLKNGKAVKSAKTWWRQRRPESVEDFDREVYGRVPRVTPKVKWEVTATTRETNGEVPVVVKKLVGHVDNSSFPQITVDIQLTLTIPEPSRESRWQATKFANGAKFRSLPPSFARVPVIMEFGFGPGRLTPPPGPTWQQQVLARGWGYAILIANSIQADNGGGLTQGSSGW